MSEEKDIRAGLPSASSFSMDVACPGRQQMLRSLRPSNVVVDVEAEEWMARGSRVHLAQLTGDDSALADDEKDDSEKCRAIAKEVFSEWQETLPEGVVIREIREQRLWLKDGKGSDVMSGQPDLVYITGSVACLMDYKTGFSRNLTRSDRNWQLRSLAVLLWQNYGCTHVRVGFIKPKSKRDPSDVTDYGPEELRESYRRIEHALKASADPEAPRRSGVHCSWCAARHVCPEGASLSMLPSVVARIASPAKKKDVIEAVAHLTPADWKYIWQRGSTIRNILDAANACLKALPAEQLAELSMKVGNGRRMETVTSPQDLFAALTAELPEKSVWPAFTFTKSKLVESLMVEKLMSKAEAEKWVAERIKPFVNEGRSEGSLEEV